MILPVSLLFTQYCSVANNGRSLAIADHLGALVGKKTLELQT